MISKAQHHTGSMFGPLSLLLVGAPLLFSAWNVQAPDGAESTSSAVKPVEVSISEGNLQVPETVQPNATSFQITNEGSEAHGLAISGPIEASLDGEIAPGQTETLEVSLEPGTYTARCPVDGHQESAEFTVGR